MMNDNELFQYIIKDLGSEENKNSEIQDLRERNNELENQLSEYNGQYHYNSYDYETEYDPKINGSIWSLTIFGCIFLVYAIYRVFKKVK